MVESQAATPQHTQYDASGDDYLKGTSPPAINGDVKLEEETQADAANKMDVDETPAPQQEEKSALRRSPSVDMITSPAPAQADELLKPDEESLDDKIERIVQTSDSPVVEGAKYYVVDVRWWKRFLAQMSDYKPSKEDDFDINAPVPPLDTSYLIDRIEVFPNGKTFPVLKENLQLMLDFEIVPQVVWDELVSLYGVNDKSPILVRQAVNTADREAKQKNVTVDLHPPIYTVYLLTPSISTFQQLKESVNKAPKKITMGKTAKFQEFLIEIKQLLGLESRDKIRIWRFRETEGSRAPKTSKVDIITFLDYEIGTTKELIDLPDNTKQVLAGSYNGKMTLVEAGISQDKYFIVEIEEDGEWPSDRVGRAIQRTGVDTIRVTKGTQVTTSVSSAKQANSSNNKQVRPQVTKSLISSVPAIARNVMTRRDGRAPGAVGFSNLGNTCYMNSALQCIKSVEELSRYFIEGLHKRELNPRNPISSGGKIATMYAQLVQTVYSTSAGSSVAPREFKAGVGRHNTIFSGYGQQDSQEFVSYLLDTLHEDLNRILQKPVVEFPDSTDEMVGDPVAIAKLAEENWELYRKRNDSVIIDLFAGMYKSTVTCPVCDKTSIKFDPWLSCQLPLPMENLWSKAITFVPAANSVSPYERLVTVHVEMEKYATIKQLKDFVGKRLGVDSKKMVVSEVFRNKFYKHHEDNKAVSEAIMPNDQIYVYEVDETPTNFPSPKKKKPMMMMTRLTMSSMFHSSWDDDEYEDDFDKTETRELLVPVFNRLYKDNRRMGADLFGIPSFIVLNKEEQKDPDAILKKVVSNLQKFTTSDMYSPDLSPKRPGGQQAGMRHVEPNVLEEEGEVVNIPASKAESDTDTGTEDFVDVKMGDAESELNVDMTATPATTRSDVSEEVLRHWRQLFTMKIMPRKGYVVLPTAWNGIELNLEMLKSRIVEVPTPVEEDPPEPKKTNGSKYFHSPPASDESDADAETEHDQTGVADMMDASDEDVTEPAVLQKTRNAFSSISTHSFYGNGGSAKSSSASIKKKASARKAGKKPMVVEQGPLVKLGEALVCDWNQDAFDAVFGGKSGDSFRGSSHFDAVEEFVDEELLKKRTAREARRRRGIHIDDCFDEFGREEILNDDNQWYCPRCKEHRNAKKSMQIWRVPDIIALQFKRFSSTRSFRDKIDATIEFPIEGLDLTERVLESDGKSLIYDLIAVDNHFGGLGGGHYTANARNWVDNKWYYFDDSSARQTAASSINGSAAYLVFYRRRSSGILGGPKMEVLLEKTMANAMDSDDEDSPNGAGSPNGDPSSFSGARYSSGSQLGSSSQAYSGDGQRGGAGGISSLSRLHGSSGATATRATSSFAGQTTPPPEEKRSFTITPDDNSYYHSVNPTRPPISSSTLFGPSTSSAGVGSGTFKTSGLGAHHDFGVSRAYGYDGVGIDEGLDADDDYDDGGILGHDSPGLQDSDDDDDGFLFGPVGPAPMSEVSPYFEDYDDSDSNIPGSGTISFAIPHYSIISRDSPHYERYDNVREELAGVLEGGSYTMTLVFKKTTVIKPCVLIVTPQTDVADQLQALCEGMKLELEIIEGEPTFNYELPDDSDRISNNLGTLIGPVDSPGKFSAVALYLRDAATRDVYALTTASAFAQRDPEVETNIPPRFLTTALPEGSIVTQPPTQPGESVSMATAFGTLTKMYELDICETVEHETFMFNYALIKVNKDRVGTNAVLSKGINRPVITCVPVSEVPETTKVTVTQGGGGQPAAESKYGSVVTDVHDMARFPGRPFKMYTLFSENKSLSTPGTLGSVCCSPERVGFAASGMVSGRARTAGGYVSAGGNVLHLVQSIEWIFRRVKERWDVDLELLD
ncbi:CSN-associated deubiquitinating enzyme Ubp12 [Orbilia brochopaga]|uniref:ubiquitinyl hydrolase 1 n=1 Tax=Orbilia brochopaga TaxID=3140254 RepID=A0AAV9UV02_9PEZI